jgi:hypothetical protein
MSAVPIDRECAQFRLNQLCDYMERLADRCGWDKLETQCSEIERLNRDRYKAYLAEADQLDAALGV